MLGAQLQGLKDISSDLSRTLQRNCISTADFLILKKILHPCKRLHTKQVAPKVSFLMNHNVEWWPRKGGMERWEGESGGCSSLIAILAENKNRRIWGTCLLTKYNTRVYYTRVLLQEIAPVKLQTQGRIVSQSCQVIDRIWILIAVSSSSAWGDSSSTGLFSKPRVIACTTKVDSGKLYGNIKMVTSTKD